MEAFIKAISYYLPEKVVTNEQLVEEFPEWSVEKIAKKVGINERHIAAEDETAGDMAFKAAEKLITENRIDKSTIDTGKYKLRWSEEYKENSNQLISLRAAQ